MKSINTYLTERQFLNRLEQLPQSKDCLSDKCGESGLYVYNINGNRFWLGKYVYKSRSYGFLPTRLNCKYEIGENGRVILTYRKARHPLYTVLLSLTLAIGTFYCISSFINVFTKFEIEELIIALAFLVIGLYGLIIKPYKEWKNLEKHLHTICNLEK